MRSMMKILAMLVAALLLGVPGAHAQSAVTATSVNQDRKYQLLREDEDWSFLRDPSLREDFWDPIKYIPLRKQAAERYMPYVDLHYGPHVRTFTELKSGLNSFRAGGRARSMKRSLIFRRHFFNNRTRPYQLYRSSSSRRNGVSA